jgi:hypothetical protein
MVATAINCAVQGLLGVPVTVEADVANGLPSFVIVEPTGRAIQRGARMDHPRLRQNSEH